MDKRKVTKDMFQLSPADTSLQEKISKPSLTFWQDARKRLFQNKLSTAAMVIVIIIALLAIFGPYFNSYTYDQQIEPHRAHVKLPPRIPGLEKLGIFDGTNSMGKNPYIEKGIEDEYFWFGTDSLARDLWTRVWEGVRVSLYVGLLAASISLFIGVTYGGISGFYGGTTDVIMMRITEIIGGIPQLVVLILFLLIFPPGIFTMSLAMVITYWIGMARMTRGQVLKIKNDEFVLAARTLGASRTQLIMKHILPNIIPTVIIVVTFVIPGAIFYEAFLSFIGLGLPAPNSSLGILINEGFKYLKTYPYMMIIPSVVLSTVMLCLNIFANGLRDAIDPKLRGN